MIYYVIFSVFITAPNMVPPMSDADGTQAPNTGRNTVNSLHKSNPFTMCNTCTTLYKCTVPPLACTNYRALTLTNGLMCLDLCPILNK